MKLRPILLGAATLTLAAAPAAAADWWLIPGQHGDRAAVFADAETLVQRPGEAGLSVLRIDRAGRALERFQTVDCRGPAERRGEEALRRFACAPEEDRDHFGLIVVGTPAETARIIFGPGAAGDGDDMPQL